MRLIWYSQSKIKINIDNEKKKTFSHHLSWHSNRKWHKLIIYWARSRNIVAIRCLNWKPFKCLSIKLDHKVAHKQSRQTCERYSSVFFWLICFCPERLQCVRLHTCAILYQCSINLNKTWDSTIHSTSAMTTTVLLLLLQQKHCQVFECESRELKVGKVFF